MSRENLRIVIADRDEQHSRALRAGLEAAGHAVAWVQDVFGCHLLVRAERWDAVLMGTNLYGGTPLALPLVIFRPRPLLFYMTALPSRGLTRTALEVGFDAALTKAVDPESVVRRATRCRRVDRSHALLRQTHSPNGWFE